MPFAALLALACTCPEEPPAGLVAYADPRIGTGGHGWAVGSGVPGAAVPFGMVKASPDTADENGSDWSVLRGGGYHADDAFVQGFSVMHLQGIGSTDYGLVALMPVPPDLDPAAIPAADRPEEALRAPFSHDEEEASPGRYAVHLDEPDVVVELTATTHTMLARIRSADGAPLALALDLCHALDEGLCLAAQATLDPATGAVTGRMRNDGELGHPFDLWFEVRMDAPPVEWGAWTTDGWEDGATDLSVEDPTGRLGVEAGFRLLLDGDEAVVRIAVSATDAAGALANLRAEHDGLDFDAAAEAARAEWEALFAPVRVWGGTEDERTMFASALYRVALMPTTWSDADGRYRGLDGEVHDAGAFPYHTDFSLWDTYRSAHPLYTLLWPDLHRELLRSLARMAEDGGAIPRWPEATSDSGSMLGLPAHVVVGQALLMGLDDFGEDVLVPLAADVALGRLEPDYGGPPDIGTYEAHGYYPSDEVGSSVAWTMELAVADAALAAGGADLLDPDDARHLAERAGWYANTWDPEAGFFHARRSDGGFEELDGEAEWQDEYAEGNARQYLWLVPHDPEGLFALLGGEQAALDRLTAFFEDTADHPDEWDHGLPERWYWAGNEVDVHAPWLFSVLGRPDLAANWVRWVVEHRYGTGPDGLPGNDDGGATSAWLAWAMLGAFPLPGTDRVALAAPFFDRVEIERPDGTLVIERDPRALVPTLDGAPHDAAEARFREFIGDRHWIFPSTP